jgi:methylenetetrahydrofolate dehydrogenase (NADP+)/methenyltetrahydrofolate cyclohydrolase
MAQADIIDGKALAARLKSEVSALTRTLAEQQGLIPGLAVVIVGDDPASQIHVRNKVRETEAVGVRSFAHRLPGETTEADLLRLVARLNADPKTHGILVQLPLPRHIDASRIIEAVSPEKDVDGLHPLNVGRLASGKPALAPCTPIGAVMLAKTARPDLTGLEAVIVGRSNLVGRPLIQLLLLENATVTATHSRTCGLPAVTRRADVLFVAVGRAGMVRGDWIKPGAVVIDVGINRVAAPEKGEGATKIVGDVAFAEALQTAGAVTPVPGGVGPMTIACLLANVLRAACAIHGLAKPALWPARPEKNGAGLPGRRG